MKFKDTMILYSMLGFRDFHKKNEIAIRIRQSKKFLVNKESLNDDNYLQLYDSSQQNIWFFASNMSVYIVLDDIRYDKIFLEFHQSNKNFIPSRLTIEMPGIYEKGVNKFFWNTEDKTIGFYYSLKRFPRKEDLFEAMQSVIDNAMHIEKM